MRWIHSGWRGQRFGGGIRPRTVASSPGPTNWRLVRDFDCLPAAYCPLEESYAAIEIDDWFEIAWGLEDGRASAGDISSGPTDEAPQRG